MQRPIAIAKEFASSTAKRHVDSTAINSLFHYLLFRKFQCHCGSLYVLKPSAATAAKGGVLAER
jgi:hypothetical protein